MVIRLGFANGANSLALPIREIILGFDLDPASSFTVEREPDLRRRGTGVNRSSSLPVREPPKKEITTANITKATAERHYERPSVALVGVGFRTSAGNLLASRRVRIYDLSRCTLFRIVLTKRWFIVIVSVLFFVNRVRIAGYSGTPLAKKLGIKPGSNVFVDGAPIAYEQLLDPMPDHVNVQSAIDSSTDVVHLFSTSLAEIASALKRFLRHTKPNAALWVSWPKKASKVPTDITEDTIRELALPLGLVDIKVCAVDDTWSGLKLVLRKEHRPGKSGDTKRKHETKRLP
jgi:hypothetical protein